MSSMPHEIYRDIDLNGDVEVHVQDCEFLISSTKMKKVSPKFRDLFSNLEGDPPYTMELLDEDAEALYRVFESSHGIFIPHKCISTQTLVGMSDIIRRFEIPQARETHGLVNFCLTVRGLKPLMVPPTGLGQLITISRNINPDKFRHLVAVIVCHYSLSFTRLPLDKPIVKDLLVFGNLLNTLRKSRMQVAEALAKAASYDNLSPYNELCLREMQVWIFQDDLNLHRIVEKLGAVSKGIAWQETADISLDPLFNALRAVFDQAFEDVASIVGGDGTLCEKLRRELEVEIHLTPPSKQPAVRHYMPRLESMATTVFGSPEIVPNSDVDAYDSYEFLEDLASFELDDDEYEEFYEEFAGFEEEDFTEARARTI